MQFTRKHSEPCLDLSAEKSRDHALALREFIESNTIRFVNVAGSPASKEPGVGDFVKDVLSKSPLRAYSLSWLPECKWQPSIADTVPDNGAEQPRRLCRTRPSF